MAVKRDGTFVGFSVPNTSVCLGCEFRSVVKSSLLTANLGIGLTLGQTEFKGCTGGGVVARNVVLDLAHEAVAQKLASGGDVPCGVFAELRATT